jgi:two-component system response regulator FixJ
VRPVIVVDDDDAAREGLVSLLEEVGYETLAFGTAEAFLAGCPEDTACVLMDVRLGRGQDGVHLLERLRERGDQTPVIMVTGHGDVPLAVRAMRAGAADFVEKPYAAARILDAIEAALKDRQDGLPDPGVVQTLTPREFDVLAGLVEGKTNKVVAADLQISPRTVEAYRARIMDKFGVRSLAETVRIALAAGVGR